MLNVKKLLTNILNQLKVTGYTITCSHNVQDAQTGLYKTGRVVTLGMAFYATSSIASYGVVATIPAACCPMKQVWCDSAQGIKFDVTASGSVRAINAISTGQAVNFTITYISKS